MLNLKVVARADLWVYNAENFCVSFFTQVTFIFHLRGGEIKKKFFWAYLVSMGEYDNQKVIIMITTAAITLTKILPPSSSSPLDPERVVWSAAFPVIMAQ